MGGRAEMRREWFEGGAASALLCLSGAMSGDIGSIRAYTPTDGTTNELTDAINYAFDNVATEPPSRATSFGVTWMSVTCGV